MMRLVALALVALVASMSSPAAPEGLTVRSANRVILSIDTTKHAAPAQLLLGSCTLKSETTPKEVVETIEQGTAEQRRERGCGDGGSIAKEKKFPGDPTQFVIKTMCSPSSVPARPLVFLDALVGSVDGLSCEHKSFRAVGNVMEAIANIEVEGSSLCLAIWWSAQQQGAKISVFRACPPGLSPPQLTLGVVVVSSTDGPNSIGWILEFSDGGWSISSIDHTAPSPYLRGWANDWKGKRRDDLALIVMRWALSYAVSSDASHAKLDTSLRQWMSEWQLNNMEYRGLFRTECITGSSSIKSCSR